MSDQIQAAREPQVRCDDWLGELDAALRSLMEMQSRANWKIKRHISDAAQTAIEALAKARDEERRRSLSD